MRKGKKVGLLGSALLAGALVSGCTEFELRSGPPGTKPIHELEYMELYNAINPIEGKRRGYSFEVDGTYYVAEAISHGNTKELRIWIKNNDINVVIHDWHADGRPDKVEKLREGGVGYFLDHPSDWASIHGEAVRRILPLHREGNGSELDYLVE